MKKFIFLFILAFGLLTRAFAQGPGCSLDFAPLQQGCGSTVITAIGSWSTIQWSTGATTATITAFSSGNYTAHVWGTATNGQSCEAEASIVVNVSGVPVTATILGNTNLCSTQSTTLTASGGQTYTWSNGATTNSITLTPTATTTYTVTATNASGCTGSVSTTVTVNPLPIATVTGNTTICSGQSTTLTASGGQTYTWSNGATTNSITLTPTATTTYTVTVTDAGSCTATKTVTVNVGQTLSTPVISAGNISGGQVMLTSTSAATYLWSTGVTTQSILVSQPGTYSVTTSNGNGCTAASLQTVVLIPNCGTPNNPVASFTASTTQGCAPMLVNFTNTSTGATSYLWNFGDGVSTTQASSMHTYFVPGTYTVVLSATNGNVTTTETTIITVNSAPVVGFASSSNGLTTVFTNTSTGASSYMWDFGDGNTSNQQNPTYTYACSGTYVVVLTATNACGSVSYSQIINVASSPPATCITNGITNNQGAYYGQLDFCPTSSQFFLSAPHPASPNAVYVWSEGQLSGSPWKALASTVAGAHSYWLVETLPGQEPVKYCFDYTSLGLGCFTGISEEKNLKVSVSPNPTKGELSFNNLKVGTKIIVFNSLGQTMLEEDYSSNFEIGFLPSGIYFLQVDDQIFRIVKE